MNENSKYTVLIVDDTPENLQTLSTILYQKGINVAIAQDGEEALHHVTHKLPDLILLDIMMPGTDGFEVCQCLKNNPDTQAIPIIFLTGRAQTEDILKGFELGAVDYITKPFNQAELLTRVFTHLELKRAHDLISAENLQHKGLLETALEALTHPFYIIDARDYTVMLANSASEMAEMTGKKTCYVLTHHRSTPCISTDHICPLEEVKRTKKPVTVEHAHFGQDGQVRYAEVHGYPVFDQEGNVVQMIEYMLDITERKQVGEALQKQTYDLGERVKELNCLYHMSHLIEQPGISLEVLLQGTVELIPPAWQYPEVTCGRIIMRGEEFRTKNFQETLWNQSSEIIVSDVPTGTMQVCYLEEKLEYDEGPFLKEERDLLDAMAGRLGRVIERKQVDEALKTNEKQYRLLVKNVADGIGIIQKGRFIFVNDALAAMLNLSQKQLIGTSPADLFYGEYEAQFGKVHTQVEQGMLEPKSWPILQCVVNKDNREMWLEGVQSAITWEGAPAILLNLRDITTRKLREMAIAEERNDLRRENRQLRSTIKERYRFGEIIGKSEAMQEVYELILKASASEKDVLIIGESGTGKELIAHTIHNLSSRQGKTFVPVNCGAIQETLFESEFFGYRKGAFTGADRNKHGFFDAARQGTLFLDEVGELTPTMQVKLLRAVEEKEYRPVGEHTPKTVNVRIIAATNRNLTEQVAKGMMREDFFYRIHVIVLTVPALRERKEDIPLLIDHFTRQYAEESPVQPVSGKILEVFYNYDWPGNIRQLQNTLYRYLTIGRLDFMGHRSTPKLFAIESAPAGENAEEVFQLHEAVEQVEKRVIRSALDRYHWHRTHTAEALGIPRRSLLRKMKKYGLT